MRLLSATYVKPPIAVSVTVPNFGAFATENDSGSPSGSTALIFPEVCPCRRTRTHGPHAGWCVVDRRNQDHYRRDVRPLVARARTEREAILAVGIPLRQVQELPAVPVEVHPALLAVGHQLVRQPAMLRVGGAHDAPAAAVFEQCQRAVEGDETFESGGLNGHRDRRDIRRQLAVVRLERERVRATRVGVGRVGERASRRIRHDRRTLGSVGDDRIRQRRAVDVGC